MFRIAFILYLLAPTAVLLIQVFVLMFLSHRNLWAFVFVVQGSLFTWEQDWITFTLNELIVLLMFFHVGVTFSPLHENLLSRGFDGTYNAIHIE